MRGLTIAVAIAAALLVPLAASAGSLLGDTDGDGIDDMFDNCRDISNTNQVDVDEDGCGNYCDGDFDQDGAVAGTDFFILLSCLGHAVGPGVGPPDDPTCAESNVVASNMAVAGTDFLFFLGMMGGRPGPSGDPLRNAIACP